MDLRPLASSTLIVVAITYGLLLEVASQAGLFGITLWWMVSLSLCRYGYAVVHDVARARPNLPAPGIETMNPWTELSAALHFSLFALLAWLCATTPLLGDGWLAALVRFVGLGVVVGAYPASAAVLGITRNLAAAVNPRDVGAVIAVLGARYATLLGMCVLLGVAVGITRTAVAGTAFFAGALGEAVSAWAFLALAALIGAAIHAQRDDFDLLADADVREQRDRRDRERNWQQTLDRAYASIRSGFVDKGYGTVKELLASERDSLEIYQWTFNRMLGWEDPRHALELGRRFIVRLVQENRAQNALTLLEDCRRAAPQFAIPPEAAALSDYARSTGRPRLADELASAAQLGGPAVVNPRARIP